MSKKALLIGINYIGTSAELRGCINDVLNIKNFLKTECGYSESNIKVLTEASDDKSNIPTKANIMEAIKDLLKDHTKDSKLFLHYSGHGSYTYDRNNDEKDRRDETICPVDYARSGDIVDDVLRSSLVDPLIDGAELFCLFDCCHSGTVLDMKYNYRVDTNETGTTYKIITDNKYSSSKGEILAISGCKDNQTSADAYINKSFQGAMTYSFLEAYKRLKKVGKTVTYKNLMKHLLLICKEGKYSQVPQMSSGKFVDLSKAVSI